MKAKDVRKRKKDRQQERSKRMTDEKKQSYRHRASTYKPKPNILRNVLFAFFVGGIVSIIGQFIHDIYVNYFGFDMKEAANPTVATIIFIAAILTGLGVFDRMAKYAGAGLAVPVTGFANSMTASALEFKKEGLVLGVGSKMFVLAGSVIVFGVLTAFVIGLISAII